VPRKHHVKISSSAVRRYLPVSVRRFYAYGIVSARSIGYYWHCPYSIRRRVYKTVRCPSVCPIRPLQQRATGLLLWARRVEDIDRMLHGRRRSSTGPQHGMWQQMRAVPCFQRTFRYSQTNFFIRPRSMSVLVDFCRHLVGKNS